MDGILIIDKPAGPTSHDVVVRVRRKLRTKRVGHTGTLDPFATGVMVVLVGRATRLAQFLDKDEKEYEATIQFGYETDTGDKSGKRKDIGEGLKDDVGHDVAATAWDEILDRFRGDIVQVPPMYSAKKVEGKKLYEHARRGEIIERTPVKVLISKLEIIQSNDATRSAIRIRAVCSAGTYIRTLAEDIGRAAGVPAHLTELRRTRAGKFDLGDAITLEEFGQMEQAADRLLAVNTAVDHLPTFILDAARAEKTKNGLSTRIPDGDYTAGEAIRMIGPDAELLAIGFFDAAEKSIRPKVVLV